MKKILGDCPDCLGGECGMNCSSAVHCTQSEWIAASIWAGEFPKKATAKQVDAYLAAQAIEARRAETQGGSVHESAVGNADAPDSTPETPQVQP